MPLSRTLARQVASTIRARGEAYFFAQAVRTIDTDGGIIHATVRGTDDYDVWLEPSGRRLHVACTCPYFLDHFEVCKHIWATLLAAEARSLPLAPRGIAPDRLEIDPVDPDGLNEEAPDEDAAGADDHERGDDPWADEDRSVWTPERALAAAAHKGGAQSWRQLLDAVAPRAPVQLPPSHQGPLAGELIYVIDLPGSSASGAVVIELMTRDRKANGEWRKPRPVRLSLDAIRALPGRTDRELLERLCGADGDTGWATWGALGRELSRVRLHGVLLTETLPRLCATGRCLLRREAGASQRSGASVLVPIVWEAGEPWVFTVGIQAGNAPGSYRLDGWFARGEERMALTDPLLIHPDGVLITGSRAASFDGGGDFAWLVALHRSGAITVPASAQRRLMDALLGPGPRFAELPPELRIEIVPGRPEPRLRLWPMPSARDQLAAEPAFDYDGTTVAPATPNPVVRTVDAARAIRRDLEAERSVMDRLPALGFRYGFNPETRGPVLQLAAKRLPEVARQLLDEGWQVEASGLRYRRPGTATLAVRSGIDWFELHGSVEYEGQTAALPDLLAALDRGESFVTLGDGTVGLLPEEWLNRQRSVAALGTRHGDLVRFRKPQAALLDALIAAQPQVSCDEAFARVRRELQAFDGIRAQDPPASFTGVLRSYQREGLGWLTFLQRFGFGGCLADDMGLGKTVMVLALLDGRRQAPPRGRRRQPSLVVAPRSLIFNWRQEAARFTPGLRVLEYTGTGRHALREQFSRHDVVLTTYGTIRRDATALASMPFDYVVLDEAQAVKNAASLSAKATRLLTAQHRLALSGTPIENHLGELWSLFEFLNPGLLGSAAGFERARAGLPPGEEEIAVLARGLQPFILRRTKEQVAPELPRKTEQTLYCELERPQRALYDELRAHYRATLLGEADRQSLGRRKLQVLEALLRLRQAACHPGLIDRRRLREASAKLDVLVPRLTEAVQEGHKTLIFSQFTSLLAILRTRLDADGVTYEYLDGRTRDRGAKVERFQADPSCRLFLISLKAGGLGLNLTAADYVFLLDPWWNPAVEAQAIDRAHRIGQTQHVFAYRLIARDTVEERVLELQQKKRALADAILRADSSLIRDLRREDLELLLS